MGDTKEASETVVELGSLLRSSLDLGEGVITVAEEIEFIKKYIALQKRRMGDRVHVKFEIDSAILNVRIPRLLFQPVVENAIMHGLEKKIGKGDLLIRCYKEQGYLHFVVKDDGLGMNEMVARNLVKYQDIIDVQAGGSGMQNLVRRLHLYYGEEAGIQVSSSQGGGTQVSIFISLMVGLKGMYSVIVVEDEAILRKGLILTTDWASLSLRGIGEADNGMEGEILARKLRPDIVITDIAMPGLDGLEMIHNLYEELPDTEFLIISGHAEFSYAQQALLYGVKGYILKPIDPKEFVVHLTRTIAEVEKRKQEYSKDIRLEQLESGILTFSTHSKYDYRDEYIEEAISVIEKHYAEHLSSSDIAMHLGISERNLTNLFKERSGYTLLEYLTLYRMQKSTQFLKQK